MACGVFVAATGAFLAEVERSCAVLLRMFLFDCDVMCVSSWRRGILSKVVQVSAQLRKHVVWSHASVMICVSSIDLSCRLETSSLDRQGLRVNFRAIPRRDIPSGEVKLVCCGGVMCIVGLVLCSHTVGRGNFLCCCFFSSNSTPTIGVRWRRYAVCFDEVLRAHGHMLLCQHLGQCP